MSEGRRCGKIACVAKPDTILTWYRKLIAQKFDGSKHRQYPGRPRIEEKLEALIFRMARENSGWGYDRLVGALANLGYTVSDQTVGNVLRRHGIAPAPQRSRTMSWTDFLAAHMNVLTGADFFTVEVLKWRGLVTYHVLFFIHLETRRVSKQLQRRRSRSRAPAPPVIASIAPCSCTGELLDRILALTRFAPHGMAGGDSISHGNAALLSLFRPADMLDLAEHLVLEALTLEAGMRPSPDLVSRSDYNSVRGGRRN